MLYLKLYALTLFMCILDIPLADCESKFFLDEILLRLSEYVYALDKILPASSSDNNPV